MGQTERRVSGSRAAVRRMLAARQWRERLEIRQQLQQEEPEFSEEDGDAEEAE